MGPLRETAAAVVLTESELIPQRRRADQHTVRLHPGAIDRFPAAGPAGRLDLRKQSWPMLLHPGIKRRRGMGKAQLGPATHQTPTLIGRCVQRPARCQRPAKAKPDRDGHDPANATTLAAVLPGADALQQQPAPLHRWDPDPPNAAAGLRPPPDAAPGPQATACPRGLGLRSAAPGRDGC